MNRELDKEEEDYCKEYLEYLSEVKHAIGLLSKIYHTSILNAFLFMYVLPICLCLMMIMIITLTTSLQKQYPGPPLLMECLQQLFMSFNIGLKSHNINVSVKQDLLRTGRQFVSNFLSFSLGNSYDLDRYTVVFIWSMLWVLHADRTLLMKYIDMLVGIIQNAPTSYYR